MCANIANAAPKGRAKPLAVIIEANEDLAALVGDALGQLGYETLPCRTHIGAARLAEHRCPQLLVACVPAYQQDMRGAYLHDCREMLGSLPTVLMLSEMHPDMSHTPPGAVCLVKPFTRAELLLAVDEALCTVDDHSAP